MAELRVNNLKKSFGQNEVLKGVSFHLETGKFLSLLGPSGCGKTTILRIICGLETPSSGEVLVDGADITNVKPEKRNIGLVFQNYALFPSMTVAKNVGYGLKMQKVPQKEIDERVEEALELVKLPGYGPRKITQMSGGQQQRVALARALVTRPSILLLDEPLSALDRKIRGEMQYEIRNIQQKIGTTTVFVTHDQEEALTMSDQIILINKGSIEQEGDPYTIYSQPATEFASDFLGKANLISGKLMSENDTWYLVNTGIRIPINYCGGKEGDDIKAAVRGEYFEFCNEGAEGANVFHLQKKIFTGLSWKLIGLLGDQPLDISALGISADHLQEGATQYVRIRPENVVYYNN
ncbi:ABC transporter ATP-binding protein [Anaerotruncus colihominis]|uniref:ABC-type quaternary amine transporter n=1 Tax=Anaerotruncus colihominis TaxID=169435 RepID=A0A845SVX7_9FIRM|nr:ABC transporter ATP-binding protein [Anaerotruncus colihominis]MCR2026357.1 ABC transporter ATP-binding protein [Anaerotruncus colihominis]NDO40656.1 ABC transporter ATP-binding protein [Anaerotruncus colihominis]